MTTAVEVSGAVRSYPNRDYSPEPIPDPPHTRDLVGFGGLAAAPFPVDTHEMSDREQRNLAAAKAFYGAGPASTDEQRRAHFADRFVWHVPGDTDLSGDYSGEDYFVEMPARMQPLEEWQIDIKNIAANHVLVVSVGQIRGRRLGREIDLTGGHVFRFDQDARIVEAWGWCADQAALDSFFAQPG